MKAILIYGLLFFSATILFGQQTQYLTYTSTMRIRAMKNGERTEWENKNISVRLDYRTGDFISYLRNYDFVNHEMASSLQNDSIVSKREFTLSGVFPINDIINQQQEQQDYKVELQLRNDDSNLAKSLLFDMMITRPSSGSNRAYRIFSLNAVLYNDQMHMPAFAGYDNEIEIWLLFSGVMNTN
jgi:hypothetical protein